MKKESCSNFVPANEGSNQRCSKCIIAMAAAEREILTQYIESARPDRYHGDAMATVTHQCQKKDSGCCVVM